MKGKNRLRIMKTLNQVNRDFVVDLGFLIYGDSRFCEYIRQRIKCAMKNTLYLNHYVQLLKLNFKKSSIKFGKKIFLMFVFTFISFKFAENSEGNLKY